MTEDEMNVRDICWPLLLLLTCFWLLLAFGPEWAEKLKGNYPLKNIPSSEKAALLPLIPTNNVGRGPTDLPNRTGPGKDRRTTTGASD